MRWLFRRHGDDTADTSSSPEPIEGATDAQGAGRDPAPPSEPLRAWASLPPIQRTVAPVMPLAGQTTSFVADVHDRLEPATTLEPLGHAVNPLGSVGVIGLTGPPSEAQADRPDLVQRQIARSPAPSSRPVEESDGQVDPGGILPPPFQPRALAVVADTPPPVERSLVSAAEPIGATLPTPELARPIQRAAADDLTVRHAISEGTRLWRSALPSGTETVTGEHLDPVAPVPPPRRPGLGAPIRGPGSIAAVQRATPPASSEVRVMAPGSGRAITTDGSATGAKPARPADRSHGEESVVQRIEPAPLPLAPAGTTLGRSAPDAASHASEPAPATEHRPGDAPQGPSTSSAAPIVARVDVSTSPAPADVRAQAMPSGDPDHELVLARRVPEAGSLPARPIVGRQRLVAVVQRTSDHITEPIPVAREPIGPDGYSNARMTAGLQRMAVRADTTLWPDLPRVGPGASGATESRATPSRVPRTEDVSARAFLNEPDHLPTAPPLPPIGVQRSVESQTRSAPLDLAPMRMISLAPSDAPAVEHSNGSLDAPAPRPESSAVAEAATTAMPLQRQTEESAPESTSTPASPSSSSSATPTVSGTSERDLDELARRLYDRIRLRLSRELLVDRERAGALTDLR